MKRKNVLLLILFLVVSVVFVVFLVYLIMSRRMVYYDNRGVYSGLGGKTALIPASYTVTNTNTGVQSEVGIDEVERYSLSEYDRVYSEAQERLVYSVGYFRGWEEIDGSNDLILRIDEGGDQIQKYRFVVDGGLYNDKTLTTLRIEPTNKLFGVRDGGIYLLNQTTSKWSMECLRKTIRLNDALVVLPGVTSEGDVEMVDGVVVAGAVIVRRAFGYFELAGEMLFVR